jgi:tetratricopeptide (TPR) repeat protein
MFSQADIYYNEGLELAKQGSKEDSILRLHQALRIAPHHVESHVVLGKLYAQKGDYEKSRALWESALELSPGLTSAQAGLDSLEKLEKTQAETKKSEEQKHTEELTRQKTVQRWRTISRTIGAFVGGLILMFVFQRTWMIQDSTNIYTSTIEALQATITAGIPVVVAQLSTPTPLLETPEIMVTSSSLIPSPIPSPTATQLPTTIPEPSPTATPFPDLRTAVERALRAEPKFANLPINVVQEGMIIRLIGEVPNIQTRYLVEATIRSVPMVEMIDLRDLTLGKTYVVQQGDTLSHIALKIYGNASLWPILAEANNLTRPYLIRTGQVLLIPSP